MGAPTQFLPIYFLVVVSLSFFPFSRSFHSSDTELCLEVKPGQVLLVPPPSAFN